jgi:enoyl-CoA hydratase/carnithine racemase
MSAVLEIVLDQPPCNELGPSLLARLEAAAEGIDLERCRAILFTSTLPTGFCAGGDLRTLHDLLQRPDAERAPLLVEFVDRVHRLLDRIDALPIPTIAAIHGACFGAGLELALACDLRLADRTARFALPELRLGLLPGFGGLVRMRGVCPRSTVLDMLLTGRTLNADAALRAGLVSQVVASGHARATAQRLAAHLERLAPDVIRAAKQAVKVDVREALALDKARFLALLQDPRVASAIAAHVGRRDAFPYLPETTP